MEMINELRSPLGMMKVEDVEWVSSDRVRGVMAGQDGAVKLAGLALAGTSSHTYMGESRWWPCCRGTPNLQAGGVE